MSPPDAGALAHLSLRQPPHSMEAEQALLGGLLANNRGLAEVEELLRAEHFVAPAHQLIFATIGQMVARGGLADAVSLKARLEHDGRLQEVGGTEYLASLLTAMVMTRGLSAYANVIVDSWMRRELIDVLSAILERAFVPGDANAHDIIDDLDARVLRVLEGAGDVEPVTAAGDALRESVENARAASGRLSGLAGLTTGYSALDRMTTGLLPASYVVLAARPSMGKTALGLGIAARAAAAGAKVLFWTGEMTSAQLGARMAAARSWLPTTSVFTGRGFENPDDISSSAVRALTATEWADLKHAEQAAYALGLWFDARPGITAAAIRARARRMKRGQGLDLVVLDYLGLMRGSEDARRLGRYHEVTEISAAIKLMAKELKVPVLVLSQLSRANEAREDKRPTLADLRDSGAVEQDADQVMFLYRPHYYLSRQPAPERRFKESDEDFANRSSDALRRLGQSRGVAEIIVAKNRHGPTGVTRLRFVDSTTWFFDETEPERADAWPNPGVI
jgi:replicative DNA helicase